MCNHYVSLQRHPGIFLEKFVRIPHYNHHFTQKTICIIYERCSNINKQLHSLLTAAGHVSGHIVKTKWRPRCHCYL